MEYIAGLCVGFFLGLLACGAGHRRRPAAASAPPPCPECGYVNDLHAETCSQSEGYL